MKKKIIDAAMCALGGGMIGFSANNLNKIYGIILFTIGVFLLASSIIKICK